MNFVASLGLGFHQLLPPEDWTFYIPMYCTGGRGAVYWGNDVRGLLCLHRIFHSHTEHLLFSTVSGVAEEDRTNGECSRAGSHENSFLIHSDRYIGIGNILALSTTITNITTVTFSDSLFRVCLMQKYNAQCPFERI